jgi:hypothetical protein
MVGLQARGAPAINRARDLVAESYLGRVLSSTMIVATPNWCTEFALSRAYLADRATGATLMALCRTARSRSSDGHLELSARHTIFASARARYRL